MRLGILSSLVVVVGGSLRHSQSRPQQSIIIDNNYYDRSLQLRPGNGNYPNLDFFFSFNEGSGVTAPSEEEIEALICQVNLYMYQNVTPSLENECLFIYADSVNYAYSETGTINEDFPGYPLQVSFFVDGFTTDNNATQFNQEADILSYYQFLFNAGNFITEYVFPIGGMWSQVASMGFDGRARPKIESILSTVECPNNPLPPDCTPPTMAPTGAPVALPPNTDFVGTSSPVASPTVAPQENGGAEEDNGLTWWILTIIIMACILVVLYCLICCLSMLLCMRSDKKSKSVEKETYTEVSTEKSSSNKKKKKKRDDDSDDDDSDDDEEQPRKQDSARGGAPDDDAEAGAMVLVPADKNDSKKKKKKPQKKKEESEDEESDDDDDDDDSDEDSD